MKLEHSRRIFEKDSSIKCHQNPSSGSRLVSCDRTGMTKLIVFFCNLRTRLKSYPVTGPWGFRRLRLSECLTQSAHESGKDVSPKHRPSSSPGDISGTHFCQRLSQAQGHSANGNIQYKIPMNPSGIEPVTFRLVAHCLQQLRYRVPRTPFTKQGR
jgi:hypothetical protein